jgi:hypothetical protein
VQVLSKTQKHLSAVVFIFRNMVFCKFYMNKCHQMSNWNYINKIKYSNKKINIVKEIQIRCDAGHCKWNITSLKNVKIWFNS